MIINDLNQIKNKKFKVIIIRSGLASFSSALKLEKSGIEVLILEGENAVVANRKLMGATNPKEADENTIRKLYGISIDKNSVHGSDSVDNAKKEIEFFFKN